MARNGPSDNGATVARIRAFYADRRFAEAHGVIRAALGDGRSRGDDWRLIANAANTFQDRFAAAQAMLNWLDERADDPYARYLCAEQLLAAGRVSEAVRFGAAALDAFPESAHLQFSGGNVFGQAGDIDRAIDCYRRAYALDGQFIGAWERIARLKSFVTGDADIAMIEKLPEAAAQLGDEYRIAAHYANADLFDKLGDPDRAYPHFTTAAALVKKTSPYNMDAMLAPMRNALGAFDDALLRQFAGTGDPSEAPVFVVGPPRSGTTLVEQIIASHSMALGAGETSALRVASLALADFSRSDVSVFANRGDGEQWRAMGAHYLELLKELTGENGRLVNKDIGSIASVGLINLILPNAKVIFVERDPMDAAWSCFKMHFSGSLPWTFDFEDIAQYLAAFNAAREGWTERCSVAIRHIRYEDLVEHQRAQTDGLLAFCGLEAEPQCYAFHENRRAVSTASITQVRAPMYKTAIGAWRRYERHLGPLVDAMARAGLC